MKPSKRTLFSYLTELAEERPSRPLLGDSNGWLSASFAHLLVSSMARKLSAAGLRSGDYVCVRASRTTETALLLFALARLGVVSALIDPREEPEAALAQSEHAIPATKYLEADSHMGSPVIYLADAATGNLTSVVLNRVAAGHSERSKKDTKEQNKPAQDSASAANQASDISLPAEGPSTAPAFIIFTSGSTGKRKAVVLSQYNLVNNLVDSEPLGCYTKDDLALGALPMDHVFGLVLLAGTAVLGYGEYLCEAKGVDELMNIIDREKLTRMNGVPSLYLAMAARKDAHDLSTMRAGFIAGSPSTADEFNLIESALGMTLVSVYGMSECIGISCSSYQDPAPVRAGGVGPFYPMNTGKILKLGADGQATDQEAAIGEEGEIVVDGPARMVGYYGDEEPRAAFLHTGDLGYLDENKVLHITGRIKEIIIRNGNNLSPRAIEEALLMVPGVSAAAVVGLPHKIEGEVPAAMVVATPEAYRNLTNPFYSLPGGLKKNQIPALYRNVDALPLTASGKPDKQEIKKLLMKEL